MHMPHVHATCRTAHSGPLAQVHHLSANGKGNYAVDPIHNRTYEYDSLEELREKVARVEWYGGNSAEAAEVLAQPLAKQQRPACNMSEQQV